MENSIKDVIKIGRKYFLNAKTGVIYKVRTPLAKGKVILEPAYKATIENNQITVKIIGDSETKKLALGVVRKVHERMIEFSRSESSGHGAACE